MKKKTEREPRKLSAREIEIVRLVAEGFKSREIADHLGISVKTVETHRSNIMNKLALRGTADLVRYAIAKRLVKVMKAGR